jgi:hypothetical protein
MKNIASLNFISSVDWRNNLKFLKCRTASQSEVVQCYNFVSLHHRPFPEELFVLETAYY